VILHQDDTLVAERVDDLEVRFHAVIEICRLFLVKEDGRHVVHADRPHGGREH
jgi:hypothetical protein